jgi:flagellar biosynthesis protein FlhG
VSSKRDRKARVIAVTSGKGGVGKTNVCVNIAVALAQQGRKAMLVDCDMGLANANILLGLKPSWTIADLLARHCSIEDLLQPGPGGMTLVPGHSGTGIGSTLTEPERARLSLALRPYATEYDDVLIDTGSGIGSDNLKLLTKSDMILVVLTPEPTSFMDAYALVKALSLKHGCAAVSVVTNMVPTLDAGRQLFEHFRDVMAKFLEVKLTHLGSIPEDPHVRQAIFRKRCCVEAYPSSRASKAIAKIAKVIAEKPACATAGGYGFFGMEALHGAH